MSQQAKGKPGDPGGPSSEPDALTLMRACFEHSPDALGISRDGVRLFVNPAHVRLFGYASEAEFLGRDTLENVARDERPKIEDKVRRRSAGHEPDGVYETVGIRKDGSVFDMEVSACRFTLEGQVYTVVTLRDITARKKMECELAAIRQELEDRVKHRTSELAAREKELVSKQNELTEVNKALRRISDQNREEQKRLERTIAGNIEDLVLPYLKRLKEMGLNDEQRVLANVLEANLTELVDPFLRKLGGQHENLTPREVEVANLVRLGKTSKEISRILDISKRAVEFHRDRLRRKLGLKRRKKNLRVYLSSLS
ncbi:MAG: PAS domain S-box protein [Thermodesulfobacteriota bacterium]